jgi:hypothetical protein
MAKTTAPLLSFGGSGQIAKTQVYSTWRGIKYARRYVVPANPNTEAQQQTRGVFSFLNAVWKLANPELQAPWTLFSKGRPFTNRNAWIQKNLSGLRGTTVTPATTLALMIASPGANAGLAAASFSTADAGSEDITATLVAPTLPSGWTITKQHAIAIKQQAADTGDTYVSYYAFDATTPYAASIDVGAAGTYAVFSWFEYLKPDGSTAYSPSLYAAQVVA